MRAKSMVLIVIALGCGLVASIAISQVMEGGGGNAELETVPIYVAMSDIDVNEQLTANNVQVEDWPKTKVPEGATTNFEDISERFARTRLYQGEPILVRKLADEISGPAIQIPDGYRVFSLKVRMDTAVSNLVRPGDRVDIFGYFRASQDIPKTGTRAILRNVRVFAVNSETEQINDKDGETIVAKTVSVLVKEEQVAKLMLATELGTLRLALRRPNEEDGKNNSETATIESLFGTRAELADEDEKTRSKGSGQPGGLLKFFAGLTRPAPTGNANAARPPTIFSGAGVGLSATQPAWQMTLLTPDGNTEFTWNDAEALPTSNGSGAAAVPPAAATPPWGASVQPAPAGMPAPAAAPTAASPAPTSDPDAAPDADPDADPDTDTDSDTDLDTDTDTGPDTAPDTSDD